MNRGVVIDVDFKLAAININGDVSTIVIWLQTWLYPVEKYIFTQFTQLTK